MTDKLSSKPGEPSMPRTYSPAYPLTPSAKAASSESAAKYSVSLPRDAIPTTCTSICLRGTPDQPLLELPVMGVNAWAWGDGVSYGWGATGEGDFKLDDEHVSAAFDELMKVC